MNFLFMQNSVKRLFKIIGQADGTGIVCGRKGPELSVLMDTDTLTGIDYKITWKSVTSSRFDSTAFKKAMPELAERFTRSTTSRRFVVA